MMVCVVCVVCVCVLFIECCVSDGDMCVLVEYDDDDSIVCF